MVNFIKVISTEIDDLQRRVIKFLRYGKSDVQTSEQVSPFGIDSNPLKDMIAIYAPSSVRGGNVVLGYLNKNQLAAIGETRLFSEDPNGDLSTYLWIKNDGTIEVGGNTDFMVRYTALESSFNELKDDLNNHIQNYNSFANAYVPGSPTVTGLPPTATASTESAADITGAKIEEIKTI